MLRKRKFLVAAVVGVMALGIVGGTALAQVPTTTASPTLMGRVAAILELGEQQVTGAFQQAQQEMEEARFEQQLQRALDAERITLEQADQMRADHAALQEWLAARPQGIAPHGGFGMGKLERGGHHGFRGHGGPRGGGFFRMLMPAPAPQGPAPSTSAAPSL